MSTARTRLAAGIKPIRHPHLPSPHCGLVFQLPTELEEAHVGNGPRQTAILHHAAHVQVFDGDGMESACQITRELMQRIQSNGGDPRVQLGQLDLGFFAVGRALLLATETAREPFKSR